MVDSMEGKASCHSTLKSYLQRSNEDLNNVFDKLLLYWIAQQKGISTIIAQEQLRIKHHINIPLFATVIGQVYNYALQKILVEQAKIPKTGITISLEGYDCTIQRSMGLPYYYVIWQRQQAGEPILNPKVVQGKGRPREALGGSKTSISSTKRLLSAFELPTSSAPPIMENSTSSIRPAILETVVETPIVQISAPNRWQYTTRFGRVATRIGLQRISDIGDTYEPGTARERGYQLGISSIYHTDSMEETAILVNKAIQ
ncbi:hypothetical protein B7463_g2770, partial [Scytalidium lignicola]